MTETHDSAHDGQTGFFQLLRKMPREQYYTLLALLTLSTSIIYVTGKNPTGIKLAAYNFSALLYIYVPLHLCMYFSLRQLPNGRRIMVAGAAAAVLAVVVGATLYATSNFGVSQDVLQELKGGATRSQRWEAWGRYVFIAFPVCLGLALMYAIYDRLKDGRQVKLGQIAPASAFSIAGIAFSFFVSANLKKYQLVVPGPDLGDIQLLPHLFVPLLIFAVTTWWIVRGSKNDGLRYGRIEITLILSSIITLLFFVLTYVFYDQRGKVFFEADSATGAGLVTTIAAAVFSFLFLFLTVFGPTPNRRRGST